MIRAVVVVVRIEDPTPWCGRADVIAQYCPDWDPRRPGLMRGLRSGTRIGFKTY